jgi:erythromycin esterase
MMETLQRLMDFYGNDSKSIVWAHNSHIDDAKETDMGDAEMINLGQLVREYATEKKVALVGFGTYKGSVIAAREWGEQMQMMTVPPAVNNSWDGVLHTLTSGNNTLMIFRDHGKSKNKEVNEQLTKDRRGQRAMLLVSNYFMCLYLTSSRQLP